ncbi:MAG: hypothetical protein QF664_05555 [Dehalococcoidia bacterium]|jgi:hypothetical protein|nr:hypothetical protein [Dehalococcoidia bacterium]
MPGERIQRRIDGLLDQAEAAADAEDWALAARRAREALTLDADNANAQMLLASAQAMDQASGSTPPAATRSEPSPSDRATAQPAMPQPAMPSAFAGGRYEVREFLGEGGKKRLPRA